MRKGHVYEAMLARQPLRFLLADDPGTGKTIMAGLLMKELIARGDLKRCLVVCPGSLAEQWQDELHRRFGLPFDILTNDKLGALSRGARGACPSHEKARTGNWFVENDLAIARLDKLAATPWCFSPRTRCATKTWTTPCGATSLGSPSWGATPA